MKHNIHFRAATRADEEFIYQVGERTMRVYVEPLFGSWNEAFQRRHIDLSFDLVEWKIILLDGVPIGRFSYEDRANLIFLANIQILPEYQGRGIGQQIIQDLQVKAGRRPVTLRVLRGNPAKRLYERLGFVVTQEDDLRYYMRYRPR